MSKTSRIIPFPVEAPSRDQRQNPFPLDAEVDCSAVVNQYHQRPADNHSFLDERIENQINTLLQNASTAGNQVACFWFRAGEHGMVEDMFGCEIGSELMAMMGRRLRKALRKTDQLHRISCDEYVILIENSGDENTHVVAERLLETSSGIYHVGGARLHLCPALGIAVSPDDALHAHQLLRYSRLALRGMKQHQQAFRYQFYSPQLLTRFKDQASMMTTLVQALEEQRLVLHYQPQYGLADRNISAVEALVRLRTESGELLGPIHFIELAERSGLIIPLGRWVIQEACRQLGMWKSEGVENLRMAINVSPKQLMDEDLVDIIREAVEANGLAYSDLELEITENQMIQNLSQVEQSLRDITRLGVRIAVDDFGTGYSSLAYLTRLSVHAVKIDRAFVARITSDERTERMVNAIIAMTKALGLTLIAEGIETDDQDRALMNAGCTIGQGYGFSRPQSPETISRMLL